AAPALVWVLGTPWEGSEADDAWPWVTPDFARSPPDAYVPSRQHAPEVLPNGDLLVYDNGNSRETTSIVRYEIDEATRVGAFVWAWEDPDYEPRLYAPFVGDVDALPNGNFLQTDGALSLDTDHDGGRTWSRVTELDPTTKTKALELKVRDVRGAGAVGYQIYRAERMSLYP
ncbi:MAG: aryl-sulfate sulfotransferase, partial [Candidatus Methylomirabilis sp.]|nr:aryl-sulfate sulfotransferase [Deltaproteobacteria bacterium]